MTSEGTSWIGAHGRWTPVVIAAWCLFGVVGLGACDLGGIPSPQTSDVGLADGPDQICTPNERTCEGVEVVSCNARGTETSRQACQTGTFCVHGGCAPIPTHCGDESSDKSGDESGDANRFFSVSKDELVFKVDDPLKSSTDSLEITNCSNTPITLESIRFSEQPTDHSILSDVFQLVRPSREGLQLEPGASQTIEVRYLPRYAYSRQKGILKVAILGSSYHQIWLPLTPKAYCVSATPEADLGLFHDQASGSVRVHNCGTEPVELSGVRVEAATDAADSRVDVDVSPMLPDELDESGELPVLAPGEHLELGLDLSARELGPLDHQVVFDVADAAEFRNPSPSSKLVGRVVAESCHQLEFDAPRVWGEQLDDTRQWSVDDIPLDQVVYFEMQSLPELDHFPIFSLDSPTASRAELVIPSAPLATSTKASFTPDIAGEYEVTMNVLDSEGRPMCEPQRLSLYARPTSDLYVDLRWETQGDPIAADMGFGRGADLNLYLTTTNELSQLPAWDDPIESCYGLGELASNQGEPTQSEVYQAECAAAGAQIRSLSVTDSRREVMVVEEATQRFYHIGVRSWSMYDFDSAHAYLSVYANGRRVTDVDLTSQFWGSPSDEDYEGNDYDRDDLVHIELSGRQAWQYGVWDAENNRLLPRPPRRYDGRFP